MKPLQVDFACRFTQTPPHLTVEYTLTNHEPVSLGLCNQIVRVRLDGTYEVSPNIAYIALEGSTLLIEKLTLPAPDDQLYGVPPFVHKLAPAASFNERVQIDLPAKVKNPLRRARIRGRTVADRPARAQTVRFSLGVFAVQDTSHLEASEPAYPTLLEISEPDRVRALQQVLSRDFQLREPIAVFDYRNVKAKQ